MTKMTLNKNIDVDIREISHDDYPLYIEKMQEFYKPFAISPEIVQHLKILPLSSIYGNRGKPFLCETLQEMYDQFIDEMDYLPTTRELICSKLKLTPEQLTEAETQAYKNLLKGVNKRLPVPLVVFDGFSIENISNVRSQQQTQTTAHPCIYTPEENLIAFSPKNISKHYGFPMQDAKMFFQNFMKYHPQKVKLLKKGALNTSSTSLRNVFMLNIGEEPMVMWSYSQDLSQRKRIEEKGLSDIDLAMEIAHHELPIADLQVWKNAAKGWFERRYPENKWSELSVKQQQRHIVNCIRHNSVGYDRIWRSAKPELIKEFHHRVFEQTLKQIMCQFPYLAEECKRQLNERELQK
ncbi:hypothetical protein [Photobacterium damselae]|uniref:hypothetical protein n=1 Tax=Photobacterium damselae TaxID=38293 RepID=UPI0040688C6B